MAIRREKKEEGMKGNRKAENKREGDKKKEKKEENAMSVRKSRWREERRERWREGRWGGGGAADHCSKGIPRLEGGFAPRLHPPTIISVLLTLNPDVLVLILSHLHCALTSLAFHHTRCVHFFINLKKANKAPKFKNLAFSVVNARQAGTQ